MQHADVMFDPDLAKLSKSEWLSEIEAVTKSRVFLKRSATDTMLVL